MSFVVNSWRTSDGQCCTVSDPTSPTPSCRSPCRTFFRLCLSHYQANLPQLSGDLDLDLDLTCTFGNLSTPVVNATTSSLTSSTTSSSSVVFVNVPAQLQFDFTWPVSTPFLLLWRPLDSTDNLISKTDLTISDAFLQMTCWLRSFYTAFSNVCKALVCVYFITLAEGKWLLSLSMSVCEITQTATNGFW